MLTCDCGANQDDPTDAHAPDCIHHQLPTDDPSDHHDL
jgi:hypothetical protein